jgi:hypothetical protein
MGGKKEHSQFIVGKSGDIKVEVMLKDVPASSRVITYRDAGLFQEVGAVS